MSIIKQGKIVKPLSLLRPYADRLVLLAAAVGMGAAILGQNAILAVMLLFALLFAAAVLLPSSTMWWGHFVTRFALASGVLLVGVGGFNYIMNPLGIYPPHFFEPLIFASRNQKMNLFSAFAPPPQALILGSSRSFTVDPAQIEALWGYRTFNASLTAGGVRDYLAFTRFALQSDNSLKLLIINVAVESFQKLDLQAVEPDASLWGFLDNDPLRPLSTRFDQIVRLFSKQQTDASLRLLSVEQNGRPPPQYYFDDRGQGYFYATADSVPDEAAIQSYIEAGWGSAFLQTNYDLPNVMNTFKQFLELCRNNNIRVIGYMHPYYPAMLHRLELQYEYTALHSQISSSLQSYENPYGFQFIDFVYSPLFTTSQTFFNDPVHPKPEASAKMMQALHDAFPLTGSQP